MAAPASGIQSPLGWLEGSSSLRNTSGADSAYLFDLLMRYVEYLVVPWKGKV